MKNSRSYHLFIEIHTTSTTIRWSRFHVEKTKLMHFCFKTPVQATTLVVLWFFTKFIAVIDKLTTKTLMLSLIEQQYKYLLFVVMSLNFQVHEKWCSAENAVGAYCHKNLTTGT